MRDAATNLISVFNVLNGSDIGFLVGAYPLMFVNIKLWPILDLTLDANIMFCHLTEQHDNKITYL